MGHSELSLIHHQPAVWSFLEIQISESCSSIGEVQQMRIDLTFVVTKAYGYIFVGEKPSRTRRLHTLGCTDLSRLHAFLSA